MGIVLVGAYPWNRSPFDALMPRALLPVAHRPLISYALSWLHDAGIRQVGVCGNRDTRELSSVLTRHVPAGMTLSYHEDPVPRGAAGSIRDAGLNTDAETFVITEGNAIPTAALADLLSRHHASGAVATIVVHSEPQRDGRSRLQVPAGIYVFDRRALDAIPAKGFCDIKEHLIPDLYRAGNRVIAHPAIDATARVLNLESYLAVNGWMVERLVSATEPVAGYVRSGSCVVHEDAVIASDAVLVGPVLIGPRARVESGVLIVGPTSVGREATIRTGVVVLRSAVWRRSIIGEHAVANRTIVADETIVQPHTQTYRAVVIPQRRSIEAPSRATRQVSDQRDLSSASLRFWRRVGRMLIDGDLSESTASQ
jgi:mannose-1-phosphate guanylyltransferase